MRSRARPRVLDRREGSSDLNGDDRSSGRDFERIPEAAGRSPTSGSLPSVLGNPDRHAIGPLRHARWLRVAARAPLVVALGLSRSPDLRDAHIEERRSESTSSRPWFLVGGNGDRALLLHRFHPVHEVTKSLVQVCVGSKRDGCGIRRAPAIRYPLRVDVPTRADGGPRVPSGGPLRAPPVHPGAARLRAVRRPGSR